MREQSVSSKCVGALLLLVSAQLVACAHQEVTPVQATAAVTTETGGPTLQGLVKGECVEVVYRSRGCFHNEEYTLRIHGGSPCRVELREAQGMEPNSVTLTADEVIKLNRAIEYFRTAPTGGCTTVDSLDLVWKQGEREIEESIQDGTCSIEEAQPPVMSFWQLLQKFDSK